MHEIQHRQSPLGLKIQGQMLYPPIKRIIQIQMGLITIYEVVFKRHGPIRKQHLTKYLCENRVVLLNNFLIRRNLFLVATSTITLTLFPFKNTGRNTIRVDIVTTYVLIDSKTQYDPPANNGGGTCGGGKKRKPSFSGKRNNMTRNQ